MSESVDKVGWKRDTEREGSKIKSNREIMRKYEKKSDKKQKERERELGKKRVCKIEGGIEGE